VERLETGIPGLDQVLQDGIPRYSTILIAGSPGSGKTILCQNILFNFNKATGLNVLYLSTISEPQIKVINYQQQFSFFNAEAFMDSVIYQDIGSIIRTKGVKQALEVIDELVKQLQPALVAIDSIKAIADIFSTESEFREFVSDLNVKLSFWECTVLLIGEYYEEEIIKRPESAIVDGIIYLYGSEERKFQKRYLRILKMRGTNYEAGEHTLKISEEGVDIFPRLNPVVSRQTYTIDYRRQSTGIPGLDQMLGGGIPTGTTTLISGGTGTGKTLLALSWIVQGARENEPGLFITFDEHPVQLKRNAGLFGWHLDNFFERNLLDFFHISPIEPDVDQHIFEVQKKVFEKQVKRIVIDSISTFEIGMSDKYKYTDYLWGLTNFFKTQSVSLTVIAENYNLMNSQIIKYGVSYLADNIILLKYLRDGFNTRRLVEILKMRGSQHLKTAREYIITSQGPVVINKPVSFKGRKVITTTHKAQRTL
jgi:circadian clock protein KaiC